MRYPDLGLVDIISILPAEAFHNILLLRDFTGAPYCLNLLTQLL